MNGDYRSGRGPAFAGEDRAEAVQGPAQFLFTGEDQLQIDSWSALGGVTITVSGAMLGEGLQLLPFSVSTSNSGGRSVQTARFTVDSGWLQHVRVSAAASGLIFGWTFVWIRIVRGSGGTPLILGTIASGYVTASTDLYWPGGTTELPLDGAGAAYDVAIANPGAGAEFGVTVPAGARWELVAVSILLTTSAVVANRQPRLVIDDGGTIVYEAASPVAITAGLAIRLSWGAGAGGPIVADIATGGAVSSPIPNDLYLPRGYRIRSVTGALDVGDAYTTGAVLVREWQDGN